MRNNHFVSYRGVVFLKGSGGAKYLTAPLEKKRDIFENSPFTLENLNK